MADKKFSDFTLNANPDDDDFLVGLNAGDNMKMYPHYACWQRKTTLSAAQILTLFTAPVLLIPAMGTGYIIQPIRFITKLNWNSVVFSGGGGSTQLVFKTGSFGWQVDSDTLVATANRMKCMAALSGFMDSPDMLNANLMLTVNSVNPSAGNSTLDVWVTYQVLKIS